MRLAIAEAAWSSLDQALAYVLDRHGPAAALRLQEEVLDALRLLLRHPGAGQLEPWLEHQGLEHRRWVVGHLKIIYRIAGDVVLVPEIFDSRRDVQRMKGG